MWQAPYAASVTYVECIVAGTTQHIAYTVGFDCQQTDRQQAEGNTPAGTNQIQQCHSSI